MKRRNNGIDRPKQRRVRSSEIMSSSPSLVHYFTPKKQANEISAIDLTHDSSSADNSSSGNNKAILMTNDNKKQNADNAIKFEKDNRNDTTITDMNNTTMVSAKEEIDLTQTTTDEEDSEEEEETMLALLKITELEQTKLSPTQFFESIRNASSSSELIPMEENSIIGRSANVQKNTTLKKMPLPIPSQLDGISRHQLTIININPPNFIRSDASSCNTSSFSEQMKYPTVFLQCHPKATNAIRVIKFRRSDQRNCIIRRSNFIAPKYSFECRVGDVLELDIYLHQKNINDVLMKRQNEKIHQMKYPRQLYRIVPLHPSHPNYPKKCTQKEHLSPLLQITPKTPQYSISKNSMNDSFMISNRKTGLIDRKQKESLSPQMSRLKLSPILNQITKTPCQNAGTTVTKPEEKPTQTPSTTTTSATTSNAEMVTDESCSLASTASDIVVDVPISKKKQGLVEEKQVPSVGDRCRAKFNIVDQFSSVRLSQPEGWYFGTITEIINDKPQKEIKVLFDDEVEAFFDWPSPTSTLEVIVEVPRGWICLTSKQMAILKNPQQLYIGDWVDVLHNSSSTPRRARVAAVHTNTTLKDTTKSIPTHVDVYYDNQEKYEFEIPLGKGFINLVERGSRNHDTDNPPHWLIGIPLQLPIQNCKSQRRTKVPKRTVYIQSVVSQTDQELYCVVSSSAAQKVHATRRKNKKADLIPYTIIVKQLFLRAKEECQNNNKHITWSNNEDENDEEEIRKTDEIVARDIHPSLGNSLFRSMNSAEPHVGFAMFMQLANRNVIPSHDYTRRFMDTLIHGPSFNGQYFRDANRTNLTSIYIQHLLSNTYNNYSDNTASTLRQLTYEQIKDILSLPLTQTRPTTKTTINNNNRKISSTKSLSAGLQMSSCALQFLILLLHQELEKMNTSSTIPFLCFKEEQDPRSILKFVIRAAIECWLRHGFWVIVPLPYDEKENERNNRKGRKKQFVEPIPDHNKFDDGRVSFYANRCLKYMGTIVQSFIRFFCSSCDNNEDDFEFLDPQSCSDLIYEVVSKSIHQWDENKFDEEYTKRIIIRFLWSCFHDQKPSFSPISIHQLGKKFNVSKELSIIIDYDDKDSGSVSC